MTSLRVTHSTVGYATLTPGQGWPGRGRGIGAHMGLFDESARHYLLDRVGPHSGVPRHPMRAGAGDRPSLPASISQYRSATRQGAEVSVTGCGCCLPLPLLVVLSVGVVLLSLWRRVR